MSLRAFHIFFIMLVTLASAGISALVFGLGYDARFGIACGLFAACAAGYGLWFIRKSRKLIL